MNNVFPAAPGTRLMIAARKPDKSVLLRSVAIVGWNHIQGSLAFPITDANTEGVSGRRAIRHPDGFTTDCQSGTAFVSDAEWLKGVEVPALDAKPAKAEKAPPPPPEEPADEEEAETEAAADEFEPVPQTPSLGVTPHRSPVAWSDLTFGKDQFAKASYWSWQQHDVVFSLPPGSNRPSNEGIEKITGAILAERKAAGATVLTPEDTVATSASPAEEEDDFSDIL